MTSRSSRTANGAHQRRALGEKGTRVDFRRRGDQKEQGLRGIGFFFFYFSVVFLLFVFSICVSLCVDFGVVCGFGVQLQEVKGYKRPIIFAQFLGTFTVAFF